MSEIHAAQAVDIAIVGGGGIGCSIAYFLTRLDHRLKVRVYERDPSYAHASTALAAGGIRQMFSTPENILMSQFGVSFLERADVELEVKGECPRVGFHAQPYLRLLGEPAREVVGAQVELQRRAGAQPKWLERDELAVRFPWMALDDVGFGILGGGGEGIFDPHSLLQALRQKAIDQGAQFLKATVMGFERGEDGAIVGVHLEDGRRESCGIVVNAAGAAAGRVAALAGIELPIVPMKALTFAFRSQAPIANFPIMLDEVTHTNIRSEGELFLTGVSGGAEPPAPDDFEVDHSLFEEQVWARLAHRVPAFEAVKMTAAWVGHIDLNLFDYNPVLGLTAGCRNLVIAAGFSGHGAQHIPAAGRAVAEFLLYGEYRSLDLTRFGYGRLLAGERIPEDI